MILHIFMCHAMKHSLTIDYDLSVGRLLDGRDLQCTIMSKCSPTQYNSFPVDRRWKQLIIFPVSPSLFTSAMAASIPCAVQLPFSSKATTSSPSSSSSTNLSSRFLGIRSSKLGWVRPAGIGPRNDRSRAKCWFKFGKNGVDAEGAGIYGSQSRDDFDRDDVEQVLLLN